jgi:hypothetical protein
VILTVQNRAQPFLKVSLPQGATMVSVDVAGQPAKPVLGTDGTRVPLLRPGFRPNGSYQVSFVYLHAGTPFDKKGDIDMTLPRMDMPVGIVEWELFAPERYSMKAIGGNAIDMTRLRADGLDIARDTVFERAGVEGGVPGGVAGGVGGGTLRAPVSVDAIDINQPGLIRGVARDASGAALPGVTVDVASASGVRSVVTDGNGRFVVMNIPPGRTQVTARLSGFTTVQSTFEFDQRPREMNVVLRVGSIEETVTVAGEPPLINTQSATREMVFRNDAPESRRSASSPKIESNAPQTVAPSQNVIDLQRRATGVLPVRIEVPRAGTSRQFVKPLVVDQETTVKLRYKRR